MNQSGPEATLVYVGTYGDGLHMYEFDSGALRHRTSLRDVPDPSYLALSGDGATLFCTNEFEEGSVCALSIESSGVPRLLNRVASHGAHPAHLSVDPSGRWLLVANYTGGSIVTLPIQSDGSVGDAVDIVQHSGRGPDPQRQDRPHPHMIVTDPAGEFVLVPDLGADAVVAYRLDSDSGRLIAAPQAGGNLPAGSGPRHLAFGRDVYVLNELACTIVVHAYAAGRLQPMQSVSTLAAAHPGNSTAAIVVAPSGRFVYASNRGHDSIAIFEVDQDSGRLTARGHTSTGGQSPRDFSIDPSGRYLLAANQTSNTIVSFSVDAGSGALEPTGHVTEVLGPARVLFA